MSNNPFPLEDGDPGTPFYGAHADRDGSESKTKELHSYLAAVAEWPEDAVQVVARLRGKAEQGRRSRDALHRELERAQSIARQALDRAERAESNARGKQAVIEAQRATLDRVRTLADEWESNENWRAWGIGSRLRAILDAPQPEAGGDDE